MDIREAQDLVRCALADGDSIEHLLRTTDVVSLLTLASDDESKALLMSLNHALKAEMDS